MAADMYIHIFEGITEDDLAQFCSSHLGSKYFQIMPSYSNESFMENHRKIANTPKIWVGEVSWLKAAVTGDVDKYIPDVVGDMAELIGEDLPIIDDAFLKDVESIFNTNYPHDYYLTSGKHPVLEFLEEHKGKKVFTVSW